MHFLLKNRTVKQSMDMRLRSICLRAEAYGKRV